MGDARGEIPKSGVTSPDLNEAAVVDSLDDDAETTRGDEVLGW